MAGVGVIYRRRMRAIMRGYSDAIELGLFEERDGRVFAAVQMELHEVPEGEFREGFISLHREMAQELMDDLWQCGLRPREGAGSAGALAATERHLKDMQRLVFKDK